MKKILLVEDDTFLVDLYVTKLEESGFKVEAARDGQEALDIVEKKKFDLIILDLLMPNMNGWDFLKNMREKGSETKVIIVSNYDQEIEKQKALQAGALAYLVKVDHTPTEIVEKIKKYL
jgi:DNA-binding response OmpR family regulator